MTLPSWSSHLLRRHRWLVRPFRAPLMRLSCIAPPSTSALLVHSRWRVSASFGPGVPPTRIPFRPCRSSRLRRFAPRRALQACCILQPILGFASFQTGRTPLPPRPSPNDGPEGHRQGRPVGSASRHIIPGSAHTLRSVPLASSRAASPRPLPSRRWETAPPRPATPPANGMGAPTPLSGHLDLKALLHRRVRCVRRVLPPCDRPMLPWAFATPSLGFITTRRRPGAARRRLEIQSPKTMISACRGHEPDPASPHHPKVGPRRGARPRRSARSRHVMRPFQTGQ